MAVDEKVVEQKIANKEALTPEETQFVMGYPNEEGGNTVSNNEEEEVDFSEAEDVDADKDKTSEKKDDTPPAGEEKVGDAKTGEAKTEPEKTEDKAKTAEAEESDKPKEEAEEGIFQKVNKELDKPEGQEDLSDLTEREKGLYYALKSERKKRQKAEEDRDEVMFRDVKARKQAEAKATVEKETPPEPEIDLEFEGEDDEFMTVADARKLAAAIKKGKTAEPTGEVEAVAAENRTHTLRMAEMLARDVIEARVTAGHTELPDYDTTMKIATMIVEANPEYQKEIYQAYKDGRNPALVTYDLTRKDSKFATLYGKKVEDGKKAVDGKETLKKIEENEGKPKTSGAKGGGSAGDLEGYTLQQLLDMSPSEFRKVPKAVREKFLFNT